MKVFDNQTPIVRFHHSLTYTTISYYILWLLSWHFLLHTACTVVHHMQVALHNHIVQHSIPFSSWRFCCRETCLVSCIAHLHINKYCKIHDQKTVLIQNLKIELAWHHYYEVLQKFCACLDNWKGRLHGITSYYRMLRYLLHTHRKKIMVKPKHDILH